MSYSIILSNRHFKPNKYPQEPLLLRSSSLKRQCFPFSFWLSGLLLAVAGAGTGAGHTGQEADLKVNRGIEFFHVYLGYRAF